MAILDEKAFKKEILKVVNANMEGVTEDVKRKFDDLRMLIHCLNERIKCLESGGRISDEFMIGDGLPEVDEFALADLENDEKKCEEVEE